MRPFIRLLGIVTAVPLTAIYQWWRGGVWVRHKDTGWVRATWSSFSTKEYLSDTRGHNYHRNFCTILEIRDFT